MAKIKKVTLISIAVFVFAFGIIVGALGNKNILQDFFIAMVLIAAFSTVWDVYSIYKAKKHFGNAKWDVTVPNSTKANIYVLTGFFVSAGAIMADRAADTIHTMLYVIVFINGMLFITLLLHAGIRSGINEKGILHWGIFHKWNEISSYNFADDILTVTLTPSNREIKLIINSSDREELEKFLKENLQK